MTDATTPMMRQYRRVKGDLPEGVILFFRLGDFYEMFFEDAQQAAPLLDIALTRRNGVPMCGVPAHSLDGYVARLVRAGRKVAICDQVEDPALAKGIVRRELARIVTPGTATESAMLEADRHNYLAGIQRIKGGLWGTALLDLSTGRFLVESAPGLPALADILKRAQPVECVAPAGLKEDAEFRRVTAGLPGMQVTAVDDWTFEYETARDLLIRHFGVHSLEGYGCEGQADVVGAAGAVLYYVKESLRHAVNHIRRLERVQVSDGLILDEATCANLDLVRPRSGGRVAGLLDVLDVTRTAMGARLMRDWLVRPPAVLETIRARHDAVEQFIRARALLNSLRDALAEVRDLERLIARIGGVGGNARDVLAIGQSLRDDLLRHAPRHPGGRAVIQSASVVLRRIQRDRDAGQAVYHRLHRRGDRAGVGHIVAEVGVGIDARNHKINLFLDESEKGNGDAIRRRAVGREPGRPVRQGHLAHAQGTLHRLHVSRSGPVAVGREDGHVAEFPHFLRQRQKPRRVHAVVIGYQDVHESPQMRRIKGIITRLSDIIST